MLLLLCIFSPLFLLVFLQVQLRSVMSCCHALSVPYLYCCLLQVQLRSAMSCHAFQSLIFNIVFCKYNQDLGCLVVMRPLLLLLLFNLVLARATMLWNDVSQL